MIEVIDGASPDEGAAGRPDFCLQAVERGAVLARCSCWIRAGTPRLGVIGHYSDASCAAAAMLLAHACAALARAGCTAVVGPMDGTTWRRYRFITCRGDEAPFFLEPDNPDAWPTHWEAAGFRPCEHYTSAMNDDLSVEDPRTPEALSRLDAAGVSIRAFDPCKPDDELTRIFALSTAAFSDNPFYSAISEEEFLTAHRALLSCVRPDLVLLAERGPDLVGFMFAVPDRALILKTVAVDRSVRGLGLGGVLMDLVQRRASRMGFRRSIHALMHDSNGSRRISARTARTIRRYALYSRPLGPSAS